MRLRTVNCRRKRRMCKKPAPKRFCYIEYGKRVVKPIYDKWGYVLDYNIATEKHKRFFRDYSEAIAHLTLVKLAIDEEDAELKDFIACKIMEGMYTKSGKEEVIREVKFSDECDRPSERFFIGGFPRQQLGGKLCVSKAVGTNPYIEHSYYKPTTYNSGGTGTITSSDTA